MELNGWICCEIIFTTSVPRNSAFRPESEVSCPFTFRRIPQCSKHSQTWLLVQGIGMKAFGGKWFSPFRYPEIVHSRTKHKFCIFSHEEGWRMFQNTCKSHFGSKAVRWMHLVWNHFPNFGTQNSAFTPETKVFCIVYIAKVFETLENNPNHHFLSNGVECMHFVRNHFCKIGAPKQCMHSRNKSFLSFYITKVFKLLENNPNHHFLCNGVDSMHLVRNHSHNFGTPKYYIKDKNTSFGSFRTRKVY
jgi:hypothetical protein